MMRVTSDWKNSTLSEEKDNMVRFAEEKDLDIVNELRKQVNDIHVEGRPDVFNKVDGIFDIAFTYCNFKGFIL